MLKELLLFLGIISSLFYSVNSSAQKAIDYSDKIFLKEKWYVQQSTKVNLKGSELSTQQVNTESWLKASIPSTVMGVLTRNGQYKDIFVGDNYKKIDKKQFDDSWWYCKQFVTPDLKKGQHVTLHFDGINYYANIWLNGKLIASRDSVYGTFRRFDFDITGLLKKKNNILAVEIFRAQPGDFNLGFVDWNPRPVDENMGIWREVYLKITGDVSLTSTYVESKVNTASLDEASLTIKSSLTNKSPKTVSGFLKGKIENIEFEYPVSINPGQTIDLTLTPEQIPVLKIANPRLWWSNNLGSPELYALDLRFEIKDQISDSEKIIFGIRQIEMYTNAAGHKGFKLNGKEVLIKGAGWTDDIFLRDSLESLDAQIQYVKHMNLNTIRLESIWGNTQDIYDLCDKYGILTMVGWSCQWEWDEYLGKPCDEFGGIQTEQEMTLIINSFRDQILWLRNHPSIFVWMVGSDKCPKPELETRYAEMFRNFDNRPYLSTAGTRVCKVSGPSGVKMNGPYEYVSPNYWYIDTINGGAFGFNTETGPGPQVPILESLKKMLPADKLWPPNELWNYHCTHSIQAFNKMDVFNNALEGRYGKPANLEDYLLKSDAQSYEAMRAMFEAFRTNIPKSTGIIQWMLNSAWPSMYWQLYDYYLKPTAAYYAARNANQPVQIIYNYADNSIWAVNETHEDVKNVVAEVKVADVFSNLLAVKELNINIQSNTSVKVLQLDIYKGTVFLDLKLKDNIGSRVAGNFYWISDKPDELAFDKTTWAYTPMKSYTDFTSLGKMPASDIKISYELQEKATDMQLITHLSNPTDKIAFLNTLKLTDENGEVISPLFWEDNYFSLLPGEKRDIKCSIPKNALKGIKPELSLSGWNVTYQKISLK